MAETANAGHEISSLLRENRRRHKLTEKLKSE
jgi:hypothetical protein